MTSHSLSISVVRTSRCHFEGPGFTQELISIAKNNHQKTQFLNIFNTQPIFKYRASPVRACQLGHFSCVRLFSCPPPGDLPNPGIELLSLTSPVLASGFFTTSAAWSALGLSGKEPSCQCRRHRRHGFNPWAGKMPWRRKC